MNYLLTGAIILAASLLGLCLHFLIRPHTPRGLDMLNGAVRMSSSLPDRHGQIKSFAQKGYDPWIAVAITVGLVLGVGTLIVGILDVTDIAGF
jgi:hypothetical protein